jgi:hypothetical protein
LKRLLCCMLLLVILLPSTVYAQGNASVPSPTPVSKSISSIIMDGISSRVPLSQLSITKNPKELTIYLDEGADISLLLKYVLRVRTVCEPYMGKGGFRNIYLLLTDEWGEDVFRYSTGGAEYGKTIDKRSGKKITTKFYTILDLWRAYPLEIPDSSSLYDNKSMTILKDVTSALLENPKTTTKKIVTQAAKDAGMKYADALDLLTRMIVSFYTI